MTTLKKYLNSWTKKNKTWLADSANTVEGNGGSADGASIVERKWRFNPRRVNDTSWILLGLNPHFTSTLLEPSLVKFWTFILFVFFISVLNSFLRRFKFFKAISILISLEVEPRNWCIVVQGSSGWTAEPWKGKWKCYAIVLYWQR